MQKKPDTSRIGTYRPSLSFYHANGKGTGCAVQLTLHPAHDSSDGSIMMNVANQLTIGNRNAPNPTFPRFDWEHAICVKLNFIDLCGILQVLRGECEAINDGKGLFHRTPRTTTHIKLHHCANMDSGYSLELRRTSTDGSEDRFSHILFSPTEALGLCEAISGSISIVCFGIPMLIEKRSPERTAREAEAAE